MNEPNEDEIPSVGMRVKEETPTKIILEWWDQLSISPTNIIRGVISSFKSIFSKRQADLAKKESNKDSVTPAEIITIDFDSQHATRIKKLKNGNTEQTVLDLKEVSRVRIQMEELGHHFRLFLDTSNSEPFQVSIAFINGSYSTDVLTAHAKKIGKILNKPVIRQHTDLGNLISEETLQA
jgi:hypothetical protein